MAQRKRKSNRDASGLPPGAKPGRTVLKHPDPVTSVACLPDGRRVISGSSDGTVRVWDLESGELLLTLEGHGGTVWAVAVTPDGRRAISGSEDGTVEVWDLDSGELLLTLEGHGGPVRGVAVTPDGRRAISGSDDRTVKLWDLQSGELLLTLEGHEVWVTAVAVTRDARRAISGSWDRTVRLWDLQSGELLLTLEGHGGPVYAVAVTADGRRAISGSDDGTVKLWDLESGQLLLTLEGHGRYVLAVAVTPDGRRAISGSWDDTVKVWDLESGELLLTLEGHGDTVWAVAVSPGGRRAISGSNDSTVRVWELDPEAISPDTIRYKNAKVVLLGETGVGKTGLMYRLTEDRYEKTDATHGMNVSRVELPVAAEGGVEREVWLWDLAGQPDYRLIHQLFLDETGVAVVVVNPQADDPFGGVGDWLKGLETAVRGVKHDPARLLVAGRVDVGTMKVSERAIERFMAEHGFAHYLPTSAKTGEGCSDEVAEGPCELKQLVAEHIPWDDLPEIWTDEILRELKNAVVERASRPGARLVRFSELYDDVVKALSREGGPRQSGQARGTATAAGSGDPALQRHGAEISQAEVRTAVRLLHNQNIVTPFEFGDLILLQPAVLNDYAGAVIRAAREHEEGIGSVSEEEVVEARIDLTGVDRLPQADEALLLRAMVQTLLDRSLCLRELGAEDVQLVFPSQFRRDRPPREFPETETIVTYTFGGELMTVFATLVVRLWKSQGFDNKEIYQNAAEFETLTGGRIAFFQEKIEDGMGRISVYAEPGVDVNEQCVFIEYVHHHLHSHAVDVTRDRRYRCGECKWQVADMEAVRAQLESAGAFVFCAKCGKRVPLIDEIERRYGTDAVAAAVRALAARATQELSTQAMEQILIGHMMAICGEADQIYRPVLMADNGIDGEIEFRYDDGRASGKRVYVQLKHGESHLRHRKRDDKTVFDVKNPRHLEYWQAQPGDVYLVVRTSDEEVRWMNVTPYLEGRPDKESRQIVFEGERLDVQAVRRVRDEVVG